MVLTEDVAATVIACERCRAFDSRLHCLYTTKQHVKLLDHLTFQYVSTLWYVCKYSVLSVTETCLERIVQVHTAHSSQIFTTIWRRRHKKSTWLDLSAHLLAHDRETAFTNIALAIASRYM